MNRKNRLSRTRIRSLIGRVMVLPVAFVSTSANADWPTDPETPLILGQTESFFLSPNISMVSTEDDAVWVSWSDRICGLGDGFVRVQRIGLDGSLLSRNGIGFQDDPGCASQLPPLLESLGQEVVVSRRNSSPQEHPIDRFDATGDRVWSEGFSLSSVRTLVGLQELENGDTLVITRGFREIHADRVAPNGLSVWPDQTTVATQVANIHVFGIVPDSVGGAYIFWDSFLAYTKLIYAMRVDAMGQPMWDQPTRMVEPPPGVASSRHTDPVAVSEGNGGAMVVWAHGFESGTTPAPLRIQQIGPDGSLGFGAEGVRVSMGTKRQFFADVQTDEQTGDLLIVWRDGQLDEMTLRSQRMTTTGNRLWGEAGVHIAQIEPLTGSFDALWKDDQLLVAVGTASGADVYRVHSEGELLPESWNVAAGVPVNDIHMASSGDGIVVLWQGDGPELNDFIAAQRINPDGRLGGPACGLADLNFDGQLDFFDVSAFIEALSSQDQSADLNNDGQHDFFDVSVFLELFGLGCP